MEIFPGQYRLRAPAQFDAVFQNGEFRSATRNLLCLARGNDLDHSRLGMVISRRNIPKAVQRNRVKRVIRESFRRNRGTLPGCDIVVVSRPGLGDLSNRSLGETLDDVWRQLRDRIE